jgi:hypothetical protein
MAKRAPAPLIAPKVAPGPVARALHKRRPAKIVDHEPSPNPSQENDMSEDTKKQTDKKDDQGKLDEVENEALKEVIGGLGSGSEGPNLGWGRIDGSWGRGS